MKSLHETGLKAGSDKARHGYLPFYEAHLRDACPERLLELGIYKGASLEMWKRYFPNCTVEGWDRIVRWTDEAVAGCEVKNVDLNSRTEIEHAAKGATWDLIIDDAAHTMGQQQLTFSMLFKKTKLFIMEDLHTSWRSDHGRGLTGRTTFDLVVNLGPGGRPWDAECATEEERTLIDTNAELVGLYWVENLKGPRSVTAIVKNRGFE